MSDNGLDFISRIKALEKEHSAKEESVIDESNLDQVNETKKMESVTEDLMAIQPVHQSPQAKQIQAVKARPMPRKKKKSILRSSFIMSIMVFLGLGGAFLLYLATFSYTLLGFDIKTVNPINELALIITSIPIIYFIIIFFLGSPPQAAKKPMPQPQRNTRPQPSPSYSQNYSTQPKPSVTASFSTEESQNIDAQHKQLQAEREQLRFERMEIDEQREKIEKHSFEQQKYEHERKLLDERCYQIESLLSQTLSEAERTHLENELNNVKNEIEKFEEKMQDIQQRKVGEQQIISSSDIPETLEPSEIAKDISHEVTGPPATEFVTQKDSDYYQAKRTKFESELDTLKSNKQEILTENKSITSQLKRTAASLEALKTKREAAVEKQNELKQSKEPTAAKEIEKIKAKIDKYDEQKESLKEKEQQQKIQLAEAKQKESNLDQQANDVRSRIEVILNELKDESKARQEDIKQMQKVYTASNSLIKKPAVKKQPKKEE